jgi:membrane-associated phospholipid phosphatase
MLEFLNGIDRTVFLFINVYLANPVTDFIMPLVTSDMLLRVMYGAGVAMFLWRGDRRIRWLVLFSALALLLTDQLTGNLLKELIARPRPCHELKQVHLLVDCGAGFSLPSAHAANMFGQATLFSYHVKLIRWYLVLFASLVA